MDGQTQKTVFIGKKIEDYLRFFTHAGGTSFPIFARGHLCNLCHFVFLLSMEGWGLMGGPGSEEGWRPGSLGRGMGTWGRTDVRMFVRSDGQTDGGIKGRTDRRTDVQTGVLPCVL